MVSLPFTDGSCSCYDLEAAKILDDFLPAQLFDAHMHLYPNGPTSAAPGSIAATFRRCDRAAYMAHMTQLAGPHRSIRMNIIPFPFQDMKHQSNGQLAAAHAFVSQQVALDDACVCEVLVLPGDTTEDITARITTPAVRGLKCYHVFADKAQTWNCGIAEYLPEAAWEVAQHRKMCITLHMVRDLALLDQDNLQYIQTMARRYPDATLILAHAARGFASWTAVESVGLLSGYDNVWFDFSAVCESPAIFQILKKNGTKRCLWGSDYPVSALHGKAISLGDSFFWIYRRELAYFASQTPDLHAWLVGTETIMAIRQACIMAELGPTAVEDIFFRNALHLFAR